MLEAYAKSEDSKQKVEHAVAKDTGWAVARKQGVDSDLVTFICLPIFVSVGPGMSDVLDGPLHASRT
jgi:hypothetical protein